MRYLWMLVDALSAPIIHRTQCRQIIVQRAPRNATDLRFAIWRRSIDKIDLSEVWVENVNRNVRKTKRNMCCVSGFDEPQKASVLCWSCWLSHTYQVNPSKVLSGQILERVDCEDQSVFFLSPTRSLNDRQISINVVEMKVVELRTYTGNFCLCGRVVIGHLWADVSCQHSCQCAAIAPLELHK